MISNEKKRVVVTLTKQVADNLHKIAKQMGLSKSGLITIWVNANAKENEQKK
ncbi:transcriptional regulator [Enterococcus faecium]|nr:transcriptional regulator [Enterococcus faecium]